jgi:hypothetical protein
VRLLLLTLLVALGFVATSAEPRLFAPERQVAEGAWQQGGAEGFLERAPPARAPVSVTARAGHTSASSRLTDGAGGLLAERSHASATPSVAGDDLSAGAAGIGERAGRRQPEGRGPPVRPTAA